MTQDSTTTALAQRVALYEDWNARLQLQLQQLLRLPQNELSKFASRMNNAEIAVPLLQCYDATILEKQEELEMVRSENSHLKSLLATAQRGHDEAVHAARLAEELVRSGGERYRDDMQKSQALIDGLQGELAALKTRSVALVESESALQSQLAVEKQRTLQLTEELEKERLRNAQLDEALAAATKRNKALRNQEEEVVTTAETQKIQLQLVAKENEDKMLEIERLRNKMVHALKQQQDNHVAHLRILEEKHRGSLDGLREELRAQNATVLKLRAQLARCDVFSGSANGGSATGGQLVVRSTADVLEAQTRQAQDLELKRLYAEITAAQLQRDDAVHRYEQLVTSRRTDADDRIAEARRDVEQQRIKGKEVEERCLRLETELSAARDQLRNAKEKGKAALSDLQAVTNERDALARRCEELKKAHQRSEAALTEARTARDEAVASEQRSQQQLERKVQEARQQETAARDRHRGELEAVENSVSNLTAQLNEALFAKLQITSQLQERQRTVELQNGKLDKLLLGIQAYKEQLLKCDERLVAYAALEQQWKQEGRQLALQIEQLKMELARAARDHERLSHELQHRRFA